MEYESRRLDFEKFSNRVQAVRADKVLHYIFIAFLRKRTGNTYRWTYTCTP